MNCLKFRFKNLNINSKCCERTINIKVNIDSVNNIECEEELKKYLLNTLHNQLKKKTSIKIPLENKKKSQIFYI